MGMPTPNLRPRGTRKSLNKPYTRSNWIPNTPPVLVSKDQKLGRLGRAGWDVWESLGCPAWLSQPQSIWDRSLLAEWKFWLHMAPSDLRSSPLLTAGKFIFGDFPTSLTLPLQRVRSHPVIMTLVLKQLFILFHLGLVAHAHWWRALPIPPPHPFPHGSVPFSFCWRRLHQVAGWGVGWRENTRFWVLSSSPGIKKWNGGRRDKKTLRFKALGPSWVRLLNGLPFIRTVFRVAKSRCMAFRSSPGEERFENSHLNCPTQANFSILPTNSRSFLIYFPPSYGFCLLQLRNRDNS